MMPGPSRMPRTTIVRRSALIREGRSAGGTRESMRAEDANPTRSAPSSRAAASMPSRVVAIAIVASAAPRGAASCSAGRCRPACPVVESRGSLCTGLDEFLVSFIFGLTVGRWTEAHESDGLAAAHGVRTAHRDVLLAVGNADELPEILAHGADVPALEARREGPYFAVV